jgi:hypothetical protein
MGEKANGMRLQLALNVENIEEAVAYYSIDPRP